jgi:hypothetical protein
MIQYNYLPLTPDEVPVQKIFTIGEVTYKFEFWYNTENDFYTVYIRDVDDKLLYTSKLCYGLSMVHAIIDGLDFPDEIIPFNFGQFFSDKIVLPVELNKVTLDTNVRLYIDNAETV